MPDIWEQWNACRETRKWSSIRVFLDSFAESGKLHHVYRYIDSLSLPEIRYLHTRGLIDRDIGSYPNEINDVTYLLTSIGSLLRVRRYRKSLITGERQSLFHHLSLVPFSFVDYLESLTEENCRDVVMYDNFDIEPFIEMFDNDDEKSFTTWLTESKNLKPWLIYQMMTGDDSVDRDGILLGILQIRDDILFKYLAERGVRFSKQMSEYLILAI